MVWNTNLISLNHLLASLYPLQEQSVRLVQAAGIPLGMVAFQSRSIDNWHRILEEASRRHLVGALIEAAREDYPDEGRLAQAAAGNLTPPAGPSPTDALWRSSPDPASLEKLMGAQSTLLPIHFLEMGIARARSVARVVLEGGSGSGFLTDDNLFVTNHHVIADERAAASARLQFNYQKTCDGADARFVEFELDPAAGFATSPVSGGHDWTIVRVRGRANDDWGAVPVRPLDASRTRWVNIIQHPGGGQKQIALYHNLVHYVDADVVQYLTDTLPGSSGSPVFDSNWNLVALHHSGGWIIEPKSKKTVYRNEGIHVDHIAAALRTFGR